MLLNLFVQMILNVSFLFFIKISPELMPEQEELMLEHPQQEVPLVVPQVVHQPLMMVLLPVVPQPQPQHQPQPQVVMKMMMMHQLQLQEVLHNHLFQDNHQCQIHKI